MKLTLRLLGAVALALMLAGCQGLTDNSNQIPDFQLKLYHVPVAQSESIATHLRSALVNSGYLSGVKSHTEMQVTQPFPGSILVLAPKSIQPSIGEAIAEMNKAIKAAPKPKSTATTAKTATLHAHFWIVNAMAGAGTNDPVLKPLGQTLAQVSSQLGPSHFQLDGSASAVATLGHHSVINTGSDHFGFTAQPSQSGSISLHVQYSATPTVKSTVARDLGRASGGISKLDATVSTQPGQYVILAQAPIRTATDSDDDGKTAPQPIMRLLVMRVDQAQSTTH